MHRIPSRDWIAGAMLILLGLVFLARVLAPDLERYVPLLVGVVLLAAFIPTHSVGVLVPGGVLTGIGLGIVVIGSVSPDPGGALFLASIAGGFAFVALFGALIGVAERQWWALVPAAALGAAAALVAVAQLGVPFLAALADVWPIALIATGGWVLITSPRGRAAPPRTPREVLAAALRRDRGDAATDPPREPGRGEVRGDAPTNADSGSQPADGAAPPSPGQGQG